MRLATLFVAACLVLGPTTSAGAAGGFVTDQAVGLSYPSSHWSITPTVDLLGVDNAGDPLYVAGWWYRSQGDAHEFPLPPPDSETYVDGRIQAVWNNLDLKGFRLVESTLVFDQEGPSGGFVSALHVTNNNASPRQFTLFHYIDSTLAGTDGGDSAVLIAPNSIKLTDGASQARYTSRQAAHFQVAPYPVIATLLFDNSVTTLDDGGVPYGPGDATAAFQMPTVTLGAGSSLDDYVSFFVNLPSDHVKGDLFGGLAFPPLVAQRPDLTGAPYMALMRRTQQVANLGLAVAPGRAIQGVADFDGSLLDATVSRDPTTGQTFIGYNTPLSGAPTLPLNWKLSATGDFNADGRADIVWRNTSSQKLVIWTMNGAAKTGSIIPTPDQAVDGNWGVAGAADFNGDGNRDFLWYNQTTGKIVLWYMDAAVARTTGLFTTPASVGNNNWRVVAVGDFGKGPAQAGTPVVDTQDIVWQNDTSLKMVVWHMDHAAQRTGGVFTTPDSPLSGYVVVGPR